METPIAIVRKRPAMWVAGTGGSGLVGIRAFLGRKKRTRLLDGLVAAVAVVLSDVKLGNPAKDRLENVEARAPVAEATKHALEQWARAHPEAAAALRAR